MNRSQCEKIFNIAHDLIICLFILRLSKRVTKVRQVFKKWFFCNNRTRYSADERPWRVTIQKKLLSYVYFFYNETNIYNSLSIMMRLLPYDKRMYRKKCFEAIICILFSVLYFFLLNRKSFNNKCIYRSKENRQMMSCLSITVLDFVLFLLLTCVHNNA